MPMSSSVNMQAGRWSGWRPGTVPRRPGHWFVLLRTALVVVAVVDVALTDFPHAYRPWAWAVVAFFVVATALSGAFATAELGRGARQRARLLAICLDAIAAVGFVAVFSYQSAEPYRSLYLIPIAEAALRFGAVGGLVSAPIMVAATVVVDALNRGNVWQSVAVRFLVGVLAGLVIGRLRDGLVARAAEAERLRDELSRRGDILEAANRCARALGSSLEIETAFGAFIRELRGLVPFDRTAIVLIEDDNARTIATAGRGASEVYPPGSVGPIGGSVLERVRGGDVVVRGDLNDDEYPEDELFAELGLRSEIVAPLLAGARPIGMIALSRTEVNAFTADEVELVTLLGRLAASAVQNIRAYEAEHQTVEELQTAVCAARRLRLPRLARAAQPDGRRDRRGAHAAGALARALARAARGVPRAHRGRDQPAREPHRRRARHLSDRGRDVQLQLLDVDLGRLVEDAVATASIGQDEVRVTASVSTALPPIRGDRERLRQVLANLIENAVKYSPAGGEVRGACATGRTAACASRSIDRGPGIPHDQQRLIFEKFGRADVAGGSKPGTGLGLFIARSIAEAHGGTVDVHSSPDAGSTFTLTLPVG